MTYEFLAMELGIDDVAMVERSVIANSFTLDEINGRNQHLIVLYVEYLQAKKEAEHVRNSFRFQDGEEQVDKSKVYDNYRRHYLDLLSDWEMARERYKDSLHESSNSAYHIRRRASFLDARKRNVRRPFR